MFKGAGADKRRSPIAPYLLSNGFCGVNKISATPRRTKLAFSGIRNQFEVMSYLGVRE